MHLYTFLYPFRYPYSSACRTQNPFRTPWPGCDNQGIPRSGEHTKQCERGDTVSRTSRKDRSKQEA
jgi:hypothetical protein